MKKKIQTSCSAELTLCTNSNQIESNRTEWQWSQSNDLFFFLGKKCRRFEKEKRRKRSTQSSGTRRHAPTNKHKCQWTSGWWTWRTFLHDIASRFYHFDNDKNKITKYEVLEKFTFLLRMKAKIYNDIQMTEL